MDPRRLLTDADALEAEAAVLEAQARVLRESARQVREAARKLEALPPQQRALTLEAMTSEHRAKISASRTRKDDAFTRAMRAKGYSLRSLAKALGVSAAHLSYCRSGRDRLSDDLRGRVEALVGERWPR